MKEMETAGFKYFRGKMETAARDRAGWRQLICGLQYVSRGATSHKSLKKYVVANIANAFSILTFLVLHFLFTNVTSALVLSHLQVYIQEMQTVV